MRRIILKIDARGRITLPRAVLEHLGVGAGQELEVVLLPGGIVELKVLKPF